MPICRWFERQEVVRAASRARAKTGKRIAANMAMMLMATSNSISVNPRGRCRRHWTRFTGCPPPCAVPVLQFGLSLEGTAKARKDAKARNPTGREEPDGVGPLVTLSLLRFRVLSRFRSSPPERLRLAALFSGSYSEIRQPYFAAALGGALDGASDHRGTLEIVRGM